MAAKIEHATLCGARLSLKNQDVRFRIELEKQVIVKPSGKKCAEGNEEVE
ncbi:hypothetical protein [Azospirillum largimobile]